MSGFRGIFPYLVSPVNRDGSIRERVFRDLIEHLISKGVHGITVLGSTGEFAYLNFEQKRKLVEIAVDTVSGRVPVIAGVSHPSSLEAARQAALFKDIGVDGILVTLVTYFPLSRDQVVNYFKVIARAVDIPIVVYNNPKFSKIDLDVETVVELSRIPGVEYLKDASGQTGRILTIMNEVGDRIKVFSASASIPLSVMMFGGVGWMAGPACVIPEQAVKLFDLVEEKRWDEAIEFQKRLWKINHVFQKYGLAPCIKAALQIQGFDVGDPIPPLKPLGEEARRELTSILKEMRQDF